MCTALQPSFAKQIWKVVTLSFRMCFVHTNCCCCYHLNIAASLTLSIVFYIPIPEACLHNSITKMSSILTVHLTFHFSEEILKWRSAVIKCFICQLNWYPSYQDNSYAPKFLTTKTHTFGQKLPLYLHICISISGIMEI